MKRKLLLTFFLLFGYVIVAQETFVPDNNFENYLETHDADGNVVSVGDATSMGNGIANDNTVYTSRIENVTDLDISRLTVSDATGIEGFIALENFRCFENPLSDIDLSQNVALLTIDIGKNNLTSLDLSTNTALTSVSCSRNQITSLDVSQNTLLETLGCSNNLINSLDVSNNTALKKLSCYSNPLGSLDVTKNLLLEDLDCVDTGLTVLDVTQNPELLELQAYENSLTSLDLSKNVKLVELFIEDNQITSLDVSKNTVLEDLSCTYNALTYLNIRNGNNANLNPSDFDIRNNPGLTCVSVDDVTYANTTFTRKDVQTEYKLFCSETYVPDDNFENYLETHNEFGTVVPVGDPTSLGNGIADDNYVGTERIQNDTVLDLSNQGITEFTGLEGFANVERLYTNSNTISNLDLTGNTKLIEVSCQSMGLTSLNISGLTSLEIVRARDNNLSMIDVSSNVALHTLNLDDNNFSNIDLSANAALIDFRIRENSINTLNISNNINLRSLYVDDNSLSTLDVSNNTLIETLRCGGNQFTTIDIGLLTNLDSFSIEDTPTLTALDITNNANLEDIDVSNTSLSVLDITNQISLVELYTNNTAISTLDFSRSPDIEYVECQNGQLTSLNFKNGNNNSGMEVYATGNPNLVCIQVDDPTASYLSSSSWEKDATASFSDDCNWTYVPDDNFENYLETHDADNNFVSVGNPTSMGNGIANDNYVKTANIENVMSLFIAFQGVTDITGLEDFSALQTLFMFNNTLTDTNLDLTNNTNLSRIDGGDMGLTSINVTGLTALEHLDIPRNDITTVDISTNTALKTLILSSNDLSGLDVSNNLLLEDLQIHETTLSSIDLSVNVNLTRILASLNQFASLNTQNNILLETLNLSRNPLTSYDVSHLSNLQDLSFDETNITSIDISQNTSLVEFNARDIDELAELNARNGNNNNFTEFRVTGCPNLTCIEVDDPTAGYLSSWEKDTTANFAEYCRFTTIPDDNFEAYLETHNEFGGSVALGSANSLGNGIIDDNLVPTAKIETLQLLTPRNEGIQDFTGIEDFVSLIRFWIDENSLTDTSLDLTNNTLLESVTAENTGLTSINIAGLTVLESLAAANNSLTSLDISTNTALRFLDVADNSLTNLDISANDLTSLTVTNNNLGTIDVTNQANLTSLYCENTRITALNIQNNPLLENLECGSNGLSSLDVTHLTDLFYLSFNDTNIANIDLSNNANLSRLECDDTPVTYLDLVKQSTLDNLSCKNAQLAGLNLRSGNNADLDNVDVTGNPDLTCIEVDDPTAPVIAGWLKDATASYAEFCRLTYVPDDAFETFLENQGFGNGVIDDYVYTALVEVSEGFNLHNGLVADMTGIEDFRDMWFLGCRNNTNLTSIDLSNNTKLSVITLANNNLASLDLTNNVLLEQVYLDDNANLGDVDISELTALTNLSVSNTGINSINISNNPLLRQLILNDNNFTELDISAYPSIVQLRVANNQLTSLNVANGNNDNFTWFDALGNPDLTCIKADKVVQLYPDIWQMDATASFAIYCDLTYIADANFENYLETHDADGNVVALGDASSMGNGIANDNQVYTEKINNVVDLDISSLDISDVTGIEGFAALESLNVDYNDLNSLDLSGNTSLRILDAAENDLISLDLSGYTALEEVQLRSNSLTSLLVDNNPNLKKLKAGKNGLTSLDVSSCVQLEELAVHQNLLESLDVRNGNNSLITDFFVLYNDNLTCIQVDDPTAAYLSSWEKDDIASFNDDCIVPVITLTGANPQTVELGTAYTELGATADDGSTVLIDASSVNTNLLGQYTVTYDATDASGNIAVQVTRTVDVVDTNVPLITLTGDNPQEIALGSSYTELGATTDDGSAVIIDATDFVDAVGSYTIRYNATDASGNAAVEVTRTVNVVDNCPLVSLPTDNFTIITSGETCTDKNNGMINILAATALEYTTTINGTDYSFTSSLEVEDLAPGIYSICIGVNGFTNCEQCFEVVIADAENLAGKTELITEERTAKVNVEVTTGTAPYTVKINNEIIGEYTVKNFIVDVQHGDEVEVSSSVDCEGELSTKVNLINRLSIAPNPTQGDVTLFIPNIEVNRIRISLYNVLGVQVSYKEYKITSGQVVVPMEELPQGIYLITINEGKAFKIIKQ
ncbi:immunoglobulin-like domain-containing protein [Aquimarina sp. AU119]|uniref:immunoglobulin-like domain-containing protein n=1 Tax=Aquimarina sp. AU119 TaxID=2108528 RepID=UPI000D687AE9|nr:immunoglobulin-like domain-containing protein [Aquimarina sp. AU119]